jgi:probable HAF family extracellular repeat protein
VLTDLGTLSGHDCSNAFVINSKSQVVGQSFDCNGPGVHAFLWEKGHLTDLNAFVPPGSDLTLVEAVINDRGEIFGNSVLPNGDSHAFLLIPCNDEHSDEEGCQDEGEGTAATIQNSPAPVDQTSSKENLGSLTPETLFALRARCTHRYRGFGPWPRKSFR